jgi:Eukaryotic protein of unknown function (DUF829)
MRRNVVWILGWGFSAPKQLQPFARVYRALGADVHCDIANVAWDLVVPGNRARHVEQLTRNVLASIREDGCALHIHSMSDNGFLSLAPLLHNLATSAEGLRALNCLRSVTLDSAPGIYATRNREEFERALLRGFEPQVAKRAPAWGRAAAVFAFRRLVTGFTYVGADTRRTMMASASRVRHTLPLVSIALIYGDCDEIVDAAAVEGFADYMAYAGFAVSCHRFEGAGHLRHLLREPARYRAIVAQQLVSCLRNNMNIFCL